MLCSQQWSNQTAQISCRDQLQPAVYFPSPTRHHTNEHLTSGLETLPQCKDLPILIQTVEWLCFKWAKARFTSAFSFIFSASSARLDILFRVAFECKNKVKPDYFWLRFFFNFFLIFIFLSMFALHFFLLRFILFPFTFLCFSVYKKAWIVVILCKYSDLMSGSYALTDSTEFIFTILMTVNFITIDVWIGRPEWFIR